MTIIRNVIAELGWNFMGDMELAKTMIESAKAAGANIVKFQYWNPEKLKPGAWDSDGRREIYDAAKLNANRIKELISYSAHSDIECLFSAFNAEDAKLLSDFGVEKIKIPSHEVTNFDLHQFALETFKHVYVSIGACSEDELESVLTFYRKYDGSKFTAMHCVSAYPCPSSKINLPKINKLGQRLGSNVGLSDHTTSTITGAVAAAYGARTFEKHFTSDKTLPGRDNQFALVESELTEYINYIDEAIEAAIYHGLSALDIEADTIKNYRGRWG
tara:strand:+ start:266 stop:1084 length:819 start_codon:yes stop_codon:yes gene_type:complete